MKNIQLSNGKLVIVDDSDHELLSKYKWHFTKGGYAIRSEGPRKKRIQIYMHRQIMDAKKGEYVDHINLDKLDCRRENMRICTNQQNAFNQKKRRANCSSKYKGVTWWPRDSKWKAGIMVNYKHKNLGYYENERDAALVYDNAAKQYFGEFANLNFQN